MVIDVNAVAGVVVMPGPVTVKPTNNCSTSVLRNKSLLLPFIGLAVTVNVRLNFLAIWSFAKFVR